MQPQPMEDRPPMEPGPVPAVPRAPKNFKQVDSCWRDFCACLDADEIPLFGKEDWVLCKWGIRRDFRSLYDSKLGLGLQWRWNVAVYTLLDVLAYEKPADERSRIEYFVYSLGCPRDLAQLGTLDNNEATRLAYLYDVVSSDVLITKLCERLNEAFGKFYKDALGRKEFSIQDFMVPAHGQDAVVQFRNFLRAGQLPVASSGRLSCNVPSLVSVEEKQLAQLLESLRNPHEGRPIQGAYLKASLHGLCAIAQRTCELIRSNADDLRPVLLVPCNRQIPPHEYSGLDFMVNTLSRHISQSDPYCEAAIHSHKEIVRQIHCIRRVLSRRPMIIVFIGYEVVQGPSQHLRRAIRDDPLVELLTHLVHPVIGTADVPADPEPFMKSHFVVLGNDRMDVLRPYCREDIAFSAVGLKESGAFVRSYLKFRGVEYRQEEQLVAAEFQSAPEPGITGCISEAMVAARLLMWRLSRSHAAPEPPPLAGLIRYGNVKPLFNALVQQIKTHAGATDLLLLRLVALAESGMRSETLWRCAHCWAGTMAQFHGDEASCRLLAEFENGTARGATLDRLAAVYELIVMKGFDPVSRFLDPEQHPYEYPDYPERPALLPELTAMGPAHRDGADESLDMMYSEVREAFVRDLDKETAGVAWSKYLLHQILAAEALRQQILIQRHEQPDNRTSMRVYRRALEALYNGLLALPPAGLLPSTSKWPRPRTLGLLPHPPLDAFRFLYGVIYKRMLDRDRVRRISRQWAADNIKLDIIELAHRAFSPAGSLRNFDRLPVWGTGSETLPPMKDLLQEHYIAAAIAARRCGDGRRWQQVNRGIEELSASRAGGFEASFSTLERASFDIHTELDESLAYEVIETCERNLKEVGMDYQVFDEAPWFLLPAQGDLPKPTELDAFIDQTANQLKIKITDPLALIAGIDWLVRLADLKYQLTQQYHVVLREWNDGVRCRLRESFTAFLMMMVAARLRQLVFQDASMSTTPHLPGRGARTLAQAGLEALRVLRTYDENGKTPSSVEDWSPQSLLTYLAQEVRRALDWYAVNFANFTPDSVYMLLLEARFARTVGGATATADFLRHRVALSFLNEAEERLISFYSRPRMRLRFLIERCATVRGLAVLTMKQADEMRRNGQPADEVTNHFGRARRFIVLAKLDARQADNIVSELFGGNTSSANDAYRGFGTSWHHSVRYQSHRTLAEERRLEQLIGHANRASQGGVS